MSEVYDFKMRTIDGKDTDLGAYRGKVILIVNTASKCGFTPQYEGLQTLHSKYAAKGLAVLGFPCNQFAHQEPASEQEIATFCTKNYGVDFPMFEKIEVIGDKAHPLYKHLTKEAPGALGTEAIKWNFTKFLVDRHGKVIKRYAPNVEPSDISSDIEKQLEQN
jgi:glutathione peroxidase